MTIKSCVKESHFENAEIFTEKTLFDSASSKIAADQHLMPLK